MNEEKETSKKNSFWELMRYAFIALIIVIPFRIFIAQPYVVSGSSMDPTFKNADYLIVDQLSKRFEEPRRGSVVIIKYPKDPSKFFIKRLIGFPGETVEIKSGQVFVKIDKFEESLKIFELTKNKIVEMEKMLEDIKELKEKEEKELDYWMAEIQTIKNQTEQVERDIFSKLE